MDIKVRLIEILKKENYTFTQLAEYIDMSEEELTNALEQKTLELRSLELISKTLKIPLYSFFREEDEINNVTGRGDEETKFEGPGRGLVYSARDRG